MATAVGGTRGAEERAERRGWVRRSVEVVDERLGIDALRYPVPEHANNLGWSLGGLTLVSFVVLLVTGIYLAKFYDPVPEAANQSVRDIMSDVWLGAFARGVHYWAAQAMLVLVILHLLRVIFHGSYKRPREGNYLIGVTMLALVIGALFNGTTLKWDQEGFEALAHNTELAQLLGGLGFWFTPEVSKNVPILTRLNNAHVLIIPC
jgi:quinol-cytochrome oxidoreductase complex cytochrome b subunit